MTYVKKFELQCINCGKIYDQMVNILNCDDCGKQLNVNLNYSTLREKIFDQETFLNLGWGFPKSLWRYFDFLPLLDKNNIVSIGEGWTPLIHAKNLSEELELGNIYCKVETGNPTGSFKDRQISMGISRAIEMGAKGVMTVSSGNVGAALSAYGAKSKIPTIVFVPRIAPKNKVSQIMMYGARLIKVDTDGTGEILQSVKSACENNGFFNLMTASQVNPYINHGAKTIAYEIIHDVLTSQKVEKMDDICFPDIIVSPVGGGGLLTFVYQGMVDLHELGIVDKIPKFIGVQPSGCAPLAQCVLENGDIEKLYTDPWTNIQTIATALADDVPLDARLAIPAIRESGGTVCIVNDDEILHAEKRLAETEGIFCEPASATTIAALTKLKKERVITQSNTIVTLITGTGFKDMDACARITFEQPSLPINHRWDDEFKKLLNQRDK